MPPTVNITITVPKGTSNHGDPNLLCTPIKWTDVVVFYGVNYLAHAVTVKSIPGEQAWSTIQAIICALIYPYSGVLRGIEAIFRHAGVSKGNNLHKAARAGALCVIVRSKGWKPSPGQRIRDVQIHLPDGMGTPSQKTEGPSVDAVWWVKNPDNFQEGIISPVILGRRAVHGIQRRLLEEGYTMAALPSNAVVEPGGDDVSISFSYNVIQSIVSIAQVLFASATLYKTRGDQLNQYGYAAFGLTVLPYLVMSLINLLGNTLTPDFSALYLVRSLEMEEAEARGCHFDGTVGRLSQDPTPDTDLVEFTQAGRDFLVRAVPTSDSNVNSTEATYRISSTQEIHKNTSNLSEFMSGSMAPRSSMPQRRAELEITVPALTAFRMEGSQVWSLSNTRYAMMFTSCILVPIPFAVIAGLTHFQSGHSTRAQRTWTMGWLVFGTVVGGTLPLMLRATEEDAARMEGSFTRNGVFRWYPALMSIGYIFFYACFAVGGLVVVGQMLQQYGSCNSLT